MRAVEAYEVTENIHYYECDISDWKQVEQAARKVKEEVSPIILFVSIPLTVIR
jgi:hypothetical protein